MSDKETTLPEDSTQLNQNKRAASVELDELRESKSAKLEHGEGHSQEATEDEVRVLEEDEVLVETSENDHTSEPAPLDNPILNMANGPPPPPGLHLLSDPQQQQLIQNYVQQGHDLANLTASSLAQAMVSPIGVPHLATNLLQQLQQSSAVITALPGPPQLSQNTSMHNGNVSPLSDDGPTKRSGNRNMSNDERRQRRLLRNRVAAKECRKKKKQHIHEMEEKIVELEKENSDLMKQVEELKTKLSLGSAMPGSENYRLMKEVEELNAKLGLGHLSANGFSAAAVLNAAQQQQSATVHDASTSTTPPIHTDSMNTIVEDTVVPEAPESTA